MIRFSLFPFGTLSLIATFCLSIFANGTVSVLTRPEGIEVWLNDEFIGESPISRKQLQAGKYQLRLVDPSQHTSLTETIVIRRGEHTNLEKSLSAKFGTLKVSTDPPGALISIAAELGKTPLSNEFMTPGIYRLQITHPNDRYSSLTEEVTIHRGQPVSLSRKLPRKAVLNRKVNIQLALGACAAAGFTWAIVEQSSCSKFAERSKFLDKELPEGEKSYSLKASEAALRRTLGVITGAIFATALELTIIFW